MKDRIYIDTSVIGGCFDKEFDKWSNLLFEEFISGTKIAVISDITLDELEKAPAYVQNKLWSIPEQNLEVIESDQETTELANKYLNEGAITEKFYEDALHIAVASIEQVTVLASWNFRHIVNLYRIRLYNAVNIKNGYSILEIRTPREILEIENER